MKNENNIRSDIKKALGEHFQLLGSECYQKLLAILKDYEDLCMSLIFLGDTYGGKTTLINAIVAYLILEDQKEIKTQDELDQIRQNYENFRIFKSALTENTFSINIIEPSEDEYYHLKIDQNVDEIGDLKKIKAYFEELDNGSQEILSYLKSRKSIDSSQVATPEIIQKEKDLEEKINRITVVQIPNIKRKIKIYDIPGNPGKVPKELAEKILGDGCVFPIICYIKDLSSSYSFYNEGLFKIKNIFEHLFDGRVYLSIIFTKSDLFYRERLKGSKYFTESNPDEIEGELVDNTPELAADFLEFESQMYSNDFIMLDYQLINPISILISKNGYLTNKTRKNLQDLNIKKLAIWINSIESFFVKCAQHLFEKRIKSQIKAAIYNEISIKKELMVHKFSDQIREFVRTFPKTSESLKENYGEIYNALMISIIENESYLGFYFVKSNYIKNQIRLIQPVFQRAVEKEISIMMKLHTLELCKSYSSEITRKLAHLLLLGIDVFLAEFILFDFSANCTGFQTKRKVREDIINSILQAFTATSAKIIKANDFFYMLTNITEDLLTMIQEHLYEEIDSVKTREIIVKSQKISTTLIDKIKDDKSLKPGVIEFFKDLFSYKSGTTSLNNLINCSH